MSDQDNTPPVEPILHAIADGWASPNGAGGSFDKRMAYQLAGYRIDPRAAAEFYRASDVAQTVVDVPVKEAFRAGWCVEVAGEDERAEKRRRAELDDLRVTESVVDALRKCRALGGAGIYLMSNDDPTTPWGERSKLTGLLVFGPSELRPSGMYVLSLDSPAFGLPAAYDMTPENLGLQAIPRVHHTRVIRVAPRGITRGDITLRLGWGQPILEPLAGPIRDFEIAFSEAVGLIPDWGQASIGLRGLNAALAGSDSAGAAAIAARYRLIDTSRSLHRPIPMDVGDGAGVPSETYERHPTPATGLPELLDRAATRLSMASRVPVAILLGEQPSGLGQTGDAAVRGWYDLIRSIQVDDARPVLEAVLKAYWGANQPDEWRVEFEPLQEPSELEEAQKELAEATADEKYFSMGVLGSDEIRARRFPDLAPLAPVDNAPVEGAGPPAAGVAGPVDGAAVDIQATALNGAQVASALEIVRAYGTGDVTRESAIAMLTEFFQLAPAVATRIVGPPRAPKPPPEVPAVPPPPAKAQSEAPPAAPPPPRGTK